MMAGKYPDLRHCFGTLTALTTVRIYRYIFDIPCTVHYRLLVTLGGARVTYTKWPLRRPAANTVSLFFGVNKRLDNINNNKNTTQITMNIPGTHNDNHRLFSKTFVIEMVGNVLLKWRG